MRDLFRILRLQALLMEFERWVVRTNPARGLLIPTTSV